LSPPDAQREATHFKNRVLELVETFLKKQPTSPLVLRLVFPLLELVLHGSPTEAHLTSKVTGILQSRMFKAKEPLEIANRAEAVELLNALHTEARTASSAQTAKLCSQAILYVSRALLHDRQASSSAGQDLAAPVVAAYTTSLDDFMTKKSTKVRASLFSDLATRFPVVAWSLRSALVQYAKSDGANSYRQTQAFNILNDLISQLPALSKAGLGAEIREFVPACRAAVYTILEAAGGGDTDAAKGLKADRLRDIVKFALKLARASTAVLPEPADFASAWAAESLPSLVAGLKQSEKLKSSKGLLSSVDQLAQLVSAPPVGKAKGGKKAKKVAAAADATSTAKPAAATGDSAATDGVVPTKRKKAAAPAAEDGVKKAKKKSKKTE
jgi:DNA polymerase phi